MRRAIENFWMFLFLSIYLYDARETVFFFVFAGGGGAAGGKGGGNFISAVRIPLKIIKFNT